MLNRGLEPDWTPDRRGSLRSCALWQTIAGNDARTSGDTPTSVSRLIEHASHLINPWFHAMSEFLHLAAKGAVGELDFVGQCGGEGTWSLGAGFMLASPRGSLAASSGPATA